MKFEEEYQKLNAEQKEAVDMIEGSVMVVAGPGTGKTQVLTLRIANILKKTDADPQSILALTFTDSASASMRKRLLDIIGPEAYSLTIDTFHGFCNEIIKTNQEDFPSIIGALNISEIDQITILEDIVKNATLKVLRPFGDPLYYVRSVLDAINQLKREGIEWHEFKKITVRAYTYFKKRKDVYHKKGQHKGKLKGTYYDMLRRIEKNKELALVYELYQEKLLKLKAYDYNDMITEVLKATKINKSLLIRLQEKYQYVLVDEHQDTNRGQNKILELLGSYDANPNIFIVGDEKQAIFRFQGASLENFIYFKTLYPRARLIILHKNYRSTQTILDSAHSLISSKKKLVAAERTENTKIRLFEFRKLPFEMSFIAKNIKEKIDGKIRPSQIAVLYRDNKDAIPLIEEMEKRKIPFRIESEQNIFHDEDINKLVVIFRAIDEFGSGKKLIEAMHVDFLGINPLDVYKVTEAAGSRRISPFSIIQDKEFMDSLQLESPSKIYRLYNLLHRMAVFNRNHLLSETLEKVIRETDMMNHLLSSIGAEDKIARLNSLFEEVKRISEKKHYSKLNDFLKYLVLLQKHNLIIKKRVEITNGEKVHLMTVHKAKGLEFDHVYIVNVFDGHWGNRKKVNPLPLIPEVFSLSGKSLEEEKNNEDERRLFYVAITRARKEVIISYAKTNGDQKEQFPSQFITEVSKHLVEKGNAREYEADLMSQQRLFSPEIIIDPKSNNHSLVRNYFGKRGLSATALNNYLTCPWRYFYINLLRLPQAQNKYQMYGTAMHAALKDFFDRIKKKDPGRSFLTKRFVAHIKNEPLSPDELSISLEKGKHSLGEYYKEYSGKWNTNVLTEVFFPGVFLSPEIKLTGKIDKIEFLSLGEVSIVDYKTGKAKSRNAIEGNTKSSKGDIKRQLVFYNLLLALKEKDKYHISSSQVDFVEPDEKKRFRKESFIINKEDVDELKEKIMVVSREITDLSFWNRTCGDTYCEFCAMQRMMKSSKLDPS